MAISTLCDHPFSDLTVRYLHDDQSGRVGLQLFPSALTSKVVQHRRFAVDSLAQVKLVGDPYTGGFAQGHTMRNSASIHAFRFQDQRIENSEQKTAIVTVLKNASGCRIEHRLTWLPNDAAAESTTTFFNDSEQPVTLEMLSSFSLSGITPFDSEDASGRLRAHRFRSVWSAEGRLQTQTIEQLHLERSWSGSGIFSERFGQVGTMPVRKWFPFVAVEDTEAGVTWGAQLAWAGSWQMEIFRQHDDLSLSGGLADREFGHWKKTLAPGESLQSPAAILSCVRGGLDDLCDRLTAFQQRAVDSHPEVDQDLPIVFNEWCTTWGEPQHDMVLAIADRLKGTDVRYLVIDAGWYKRDGSAWWNAHGDWNPNPRLFPHGIEATAQAIREKGIIPGLWFEMETLGQQSSAFTELAQHTLHRDGIPVQVVDRRFWNLNDPKAVEYLTERVINRLERGGFGYLKVDYNDTAGIGFDDPDSLGEGQRKQILASHRFFEKIRERLPNLVIENCSSGGHRLEPSMLARTAMSSFSDAHETVEIPIIAANLHRLILPRQSQIWAVLHRADSMQRLAYSLAATFLGRMCLSGEIAELTPEQWELVLEAQRFYRKVAPIIKHGTSRRFGQISESWRHPEGWQAMVRTSRDGTQALVVVHTFGKAPAELEVPVPSGDFQITGRFPNELAISLDGSSVSWGNPGDFNAAVLLLEKTA